MKRTVVRILSSRQKGTLVILLSCGHRVLKKWQGEMQMMCGQCLRGAKPVPLPPAPPAKDAIPGARGPIIIPPEVKP